MLEFQEGFFEQEVRNGFYIDTTMKTVWAAELEVLQKVAEICDRYGIVWYAAYGTLLGAIRHEGFVPWDDDMDIWVKRGDYNKLLKILPKELPESYFVRSPLTEEGYDQCHTIVNSGNRISIDKEWLEQYHGCPFSVGLDIFPLDYLARDEKEQIMQENLIRIAVRGVQVAGTLFRMEDELVKEPEEKNALIEEIREGVRYLEDSCNVKIDHRLIEEEKWFELASAFGKWENYFAMMYTEEESDYLVNFVDYARCNWKKFPKEWFAEVYSATFENFMLPVPCGYWQILRTIYANFEVLIKRTGTHDYPYYARQLEELKRMVREKEKQVYLSNTEPSEDCELWKAGGTVPPDWKKRTQRTDGTRKKVILCANDISAFLKDREKALDKLEEMLRIFEKQQDEVTLWWRPHRHMAEQLEIVSPALAKRYREILENFRASGWGICDETDNAERAVEWSDAYYGNMNAVLQPFQNKGRPILLAAAEEENSHAGNKDIMEENRAFFSLADYVEDDGRLYFANMNFNALTVVDKETWTLEKHIIFEGADIAEKNMHLRCIKRGKKICFLPVEKHCVHVYDIEKGMQSSYRLVEDDEWEGLKEAWNYFTCEEGVHLLPCRGEYGLWKWNDHTDDMAAAIEQEKWWELPCLDGALQHGSLTEERFYSLEESTNRLYITNVELKTVESYSLPDEQAYRITYDGRNFWYTINGSADVVCWNRRQGVIKRYQTPGSDSYEKKMMLYEEIVYADGKIFMYERNRHEIYMLDEKGGEIKKIYTIKCRRTIFGMLEEKPFFKRAGNKLICMLRNAGEVVEIDLRTLEITQHVENFSINQEAQEYMYEVAFARNALLYEEAEETDLRLLLRHCMKK